MFTLEIILLVVVVVVGIGVGAVVSSRRSRAGTERTEPAIEAGPGRGVLDEVEEELAEGFVEGLEADLAEQVEEVLRDVVVVAPPTFKERLGKARGIFTGVLTTLRSGSVLNDGVWDELEEALIRADVGVTTTDALLKELRDKVASKELTEPRQVIATLRSEMVRLLAVDDLVGDSTDDEIPETVTRSLRFDAIPGNPDVWLFVGVNGVGKTTTVGKVARQQAAAGRSVLLAAGDTFRAAAGEQLAMWAQRSGVEIVRGAEGGDPSAIVFDSVQRAAARGNDLVLADTAGRLHTKVNLVEELKKIRRVADKPPGRVTEVLLVLDATTGQNALNQAREFTGAVEVTGVVLTKLDGTAKGGVVIAIQRELGIPVKMVGLGEGPDDLVMFDPEAFVDALFD